MTTQRIGCVCVCIKPSSYNWKNSLFITPGCEHEISDEKSSAWKRLFYCLTSPGGALGYFLRGYVLPGTPNWHPVLEIISPKIDTPF